MKTSNQAYLISGAIGAVVGIVLAIALFEPGRQWLLLPMAGALTPHAFIWAVYSVACKMTSN